VNAFNIAIAASLMTHIQYIYTLEAAMGQWGVEGIFQSFLNQILILVFVIVIIVSAARIVQMIWRLLKSNPIVL
jgi:hypothetical protein